MPLSNYLVMGMKCNVHFLVFYKLLMLARKT